MFHVLSEMPFGIQWPCVLVWLCIIFISCLICDFPKWFPGPRHHFSSAWFFIHLIGNDKENQDAKLRRPWNSSSTPIERPCGNRTWYHTQPQKLITWYHRIHSDIILAHPTVRAYTTITQWTFASINRNWIKTRCSHVWFKRLSLLNGHKRIKAFRIFGP